MMRSSLLHRFSSLLAPLSEVKRTSLLQREVSALAQLFCDSHSTLARGSVKARDFGSFIGDRSKFGTGPRP